MRYLYVIVTIVNLLILIYIFGKFYVLFEYTFLLLRTFVTCRGLHFGGEFSTLLHQSKRNVYRMLNFFGSKKRKNRCNNALRKESLVDFAHEREKMESS